MKRTNVFFMGLTLILAACSSVFPAEFPLFSGEDVAAGRFKTPDWFSIPFTLETTRPFMGYGERKEGGEVFGLTQGTFAKVLLFFTVEPMISAEQAIALLRNTPKAEIGPSQTAQLAGIAGTQFDLVRSDGVPNALSIPAVNPSVKYVGNDWHTNSHQARVRCIVLEVMGRALLVYIEAPQDEFDSAAVEFESVLSTVEFVRNQEAKSP